MPRAAEAGGGGEAEGNEAEEKAHSNQGDFYVELPEIHRNLWSKIFKGYM